MRRPPVLKSRRWRLLSDQLRMVKGKTRRCCLHAGVHFLERWERLREQGVRRHRRLDLQGGPIHLLRVEPAVLDSLEIRAEATD